MKTQTNDTLTGLRGLLAISVVIYHIYGSAVIEGYIEEWPKGFWNTIVHALGPVSVQLFFVISGYLIIRSISERRNIGKFFTNRILRIYPVFLTIHLLVFAIGPFIGYKWMTDISLSSYIVNFFSNLFLLPGLFPLPIAQIVAWSLSYEIAFYLVSGIIFLAYRSTRIPTFLKYTCLTLIALSCITIFYLRPDSLFFLVGVMLYLSEKKLTSWNKPFKVFFLNGILLLLALFLTYSEEKTFILLAMLLSYLFFVPILFQQGLLSMILRTPPMLYLGKISYSLYMWHTMVMFALKIVMPKISVYVPHPTILLLVYGALTILLSIITSHLSYNIIEDRLTQWIKQRLLKRSFSSKSSTTLQT
ncbi:acyltransferase [Paenibacillus sp. GSMTC-2017]|uniref:acyltransferase family protein n=1 Tax=Paenibacillus sp. GSMTC-2017 TaxID=2794350 RepID=UPI0018D9F716|nr:acyltransferase [Paenibacillus sp. GSMTC-2017]MBH5319153.1 acyltransferase [Paenibacillus sp. GSMTC-2017]